MRTIEEYLDRLRKEIRSLTRKRDDSEIEEYRSHLRSAFENYKAENKSELSEEQLEEKFILEQEDPRIIARSLVINPVSLPVYCFNRTTIVIGDLYAGTGRFLSRYDQAVPFIDAILCYIGFLFIGVPFTIFIGEFVYNLGFLDDMKYWMLVFIIFHLTVFIIFLMLAIKRGFRKGMISTIHIASITCVLALIINRTYYLDTWPADGFYFTRDWTRTVLKTPEQQALIWFNEILEILYFGILYCFGLFIIAWMLSLGWNKRRKPRVNSNAIKGITITIILLFLVSSTVISGTQTVISQMHTPTPVETPLIYSMDLRTEETLTGGEADRYKVNLSIVFNNFSIDWSESIYFTFNETNPENLTTTAVFISLDDYIYRTPGVSCTTQLFGLFYLPAVYEDRNWTTLVHDDINSMNIISGFTALPEEDMNTINWYYTEKNISIPARTIRYQSDSEPSDYFLFYFDAETGWLMKAVLYQDWISPEATFNSLEIIRQFSVSSPEDLMPYIDAYNVYLGSIFMILVIINAILVVPQITQIFLRRRA